MRKVMNWVMAATLICSVSVFTGCSNTEDNPAPQNPSKRKEFVEHTRASLKNLAENLNFKTLNSLNYFATSFNKYIVLNPEFDKTISRTMGQKIQESLKPLIGPGGEKPEGLPDIPEGERPQHKYFAVVDLTDFNYTFTSNGTGFDVAENDDKGLEIILPVPEVAGVGLEALSITIKGTGETYGQPATRFSNDSVLVIVRIPEQYDMALSTRAGGTWTKNVYGTAKNTIRSPFDLEPIDGNLPINPYLDAWNVALDLHAIIPDVDAFDMYFAIGQDPETHKAGLAFKYAHNGYNIAQAIAILSNTNGKTDLSKITNSSSIMDFVTAIMAGNSVDDLTLTFLDCLTTTGTISDCEKVLQLQNAMAKARRNYADQQTIGEYVNQLNQLVNFTMSDKTLGQEIPMRLITTKIGVDWWAVPGLNFADENGYIPLTELLDKESVEYAFNIVDHAVDPVKNSLIVARQLAQALRNMQTLFFKTNPSTPQDLSAEGNWY